VQRPSGLSRRVRRYEKSTKLSVNLRFLEIESFRERNQTHGIDSPVSPGKHQVSDGWSAVVVFRLVLGGHGRVDYL